jgi:hypothetical protein
MSYGLGFLNQAEALRAAGQSVSPVSDDTRGLFALVAATQGDRLPSHLLTDGDLAAPGHSVFR